MVPEVFVRFWKYIWKLEFEPNYRSLEVFGRFWGRYSDSFVGFGVLKGPKSSGESPSHIGSGGLQKTLRTPDIWKVRVVSIRCGLAVGHFFMLDKQPLVLAGPNETVWSAQQKKSDAKDLLSTIPCRCRKVVQLFIFPYYRIWEIWTTVFGCHRFWKGTTFIFLGWVLLFKRSHANLSMHGPTLCEVGIYCPFFRREEGWQGVVQQPNGQEANNSIQLQYVSNSCSFLNLCKYYDCDLHEICWETHFLGTGGKMTKWVKCSHTLKTLKFAEFASTFQRYPSIQYPICNLKLDVKARHSRLVVVGAVP